MVCVLTGHGLKDPDTALGKAPSVIGCEAEIRRSRSGRVQRRLTPPRAAGESVDQRASPARFVQARRWPSRIGGGDERPAACRCRSRRRRRDRARYRRPICDPPGAERPRERGPARTARATRIDGRSHRPAESPPLGGAPPPRARALPATGRADLRRDARRGPLQGLQRPYGHQAGTACKDVASQPRGGPAPDDLPPATAARSSA